MDIGSIENLIKCKYHIDVSNIEKIKNVYKIQCGEKNYCLKEIKYEFPHFLFIVSAMNHLKHNEFGGIPDFIKTAEGEEYICYDNCHAYLTEWLHVRECNYENPVELGIAVNKLAELHLASCNFQLEPNMKPRIGWMKWFKNFETRMDEILDFKNRIDSKITLSDFDKLYLEMMEEQLNQGRESIYFLSKSNYIIKMEEEIKNKSFCHHDFAHHNILIDFDNQAHIIDFDYCILDTHLHDLCSILIRTMKNERWDMGKAKYILDKYNETNKVFEDDIPVMAAFIEFPQGYWQIGIQYYWEKQPWDEEFFLKKLYKIRDDVKYKKEFLKEFRCFKYSGG